MTSSVLPFEKAFRSWIESAGMGWERAVLPIGVDDETTTAYRFTPHGRTVRTVIALHGAGNDALFAWIGLFKRLLRSGSAIFTFDLPGHGRHNRTIFSPSRAVAALRAALDECRTGAEGEPVHAVGVSLGASVLLHALPDLEDGFASAALLVAPLRIILSTRSLLREIGTRTVRLVWREREHYGLTGLIPSFGPFRRDIYPLRLDGPVPEGSFGYVDALNQALDAMSLEESASRIHLPVLLVYGGHDLIVPADQGARLARLLPSSELLTVPEGTHLSTPLEPAATDRLVQWIEAHG
jgi:alpha-beta hydrolase superfamily lysophospholipase